MRTTRRTARKAVPRSKRYGRAGRKKSTYSRKKRSNFLPAPTPYDYNKDIVSTNVNELVPSGSLWTTTLDFNDTWSTQQGRSSDKTFWVGIRLYEQFYNTRSYDIEVHYAVIQEKKYEASSTALSANFFRTGDASTGVRSFDFTAGTFDPRYKTHPINTDKFNILYHKHRILGREDTAKSVYEMRNLWVFKKYVKVNRQFIFDEQGTIEPSTGKLLLAVWWLPVYFIHFNNTHNISRDRSTWLVHREYKKAL